MEEVAINMHLLCSTVSQHSNYMYGAYNDAKLEGSFLITSI